MLRSAALAAVGGLAAVAALVPVAASSPHRPGVAGADGPPPAAVAQYVKPVPGAVVRPFEPPPTPYAAGHRGVDLAASPGAAVRAAAGGTVVFAGPVAGRGVVVLAHPDGLTTEYEPVRPLVRAGTDVARGQVLARVAGRHAGCPASCLHWGARRGTTYLDPMTLLAPPGPVVLLPWPRRRS